MTKGEPMRRAEEIYEHMHKERPNPWREWVAFGMVIILLVCVASVMVWEAMK